MAKEKQFTIIMKGNRFGDYLSETTEGYTKWRVKYKYYNKTNEYHLKDCKVIECNVREREITDQLIKRTKEWYQAIYMDCCPVWLEELEKKEG